MVERFRGMFCVFFQGEGGIRDFCLFCCFCFFFFQAEDGIRVLVRSRGLGDVYKRQLLSNRDIDAVKLLVLVT